MGDKKKRGARLAFPGTGVSIPWPAEDDAEEEARALNEAYETNPAFRSMVDKVNQERKAGSSIPADELYRELGYTPPEQRQRNGKLGHGERPKAPAGAESTT